jgi:hypothetical protein
MAMRKEDEGRDGDAAVTDLCTTQPFHFLLTLLNIGIVPTVIINTENAV